MGFVQFLITKLVGYDILKSEKELKSSLANAKRELSSVTQHKNALMSDVEHKQEEIVTAKKDVAKANEDLSAMRYKYEQISTTLRTKDNEIDSLTSSVSSKEKEIEQLASSVSSKVAEIEILTAQIKEKENGIEEITKTLSSKEYEITELNNKLETLNAQNKSKQGTIMNHVKKINSLSEEMEALKEENGKLNQENQELSGLREELAVLTNEKKDLESQIEQIDVQKKSLESSNQELNDRVSSLEQELANTPTVKPDEIRELEAQIQKNEEAIQKKNREIEVLTIEKNDGETRFNEVCDELKSVRSEKDSLSEVIHDLESKNSKLEKDNADLGKRLSELESELASQDKPREDNIKPEKVTDEIEIVLPEGDNQDMPSTEEASLVIEETSLITPDVSDEQPLENEGNEKPEISPAAKSTVKKSTKSKEEETIDMGNGSIVDLPPITNDSNRLVQRSIEYVFDENGQKIYADEFFNRSAEEIAQVGRKMSEAELSGVPYWTCGICHRRVKIAHRTYNGNESLFFIHASRDRYCPWIKLSKSSKDDTSEEMLLAAGEISPEETEGDYKPKSRELKEKIFAALTSPTSEEMGITDVRIDEIIRSNVPYMKWRRPDISFMHNNRKVVIELQKKSHDIDTIVDTVRPLENKEKLITFADSGETLKLDETDYRI